MAFLHFFLNLFLGIWLGIMLGISALTAPITFRELPREMAGELMGKIFAQYYFIGYALLGLSVLVLLLKGILFKPLPLFRITLLIFGLACLIYAGTQIQPKAHLTKTVIRTLEDGVEKEEKKTEFAKLHKQSVLLNGIVLLMIILVFVLNFTPLKI